MLKKFLIGSVAVFALGLALSVSAAYDLGPTTLRVGSTGEYVKTLQMIVGANADGQFGPMTAAAVKAWQASHGLVADGIVGPATKAAMNAGTTGGTTTTPGCPAGALFNSMTGAPCGTTTPGTLQGGAGDIELSSYSTNTEDYVVEGGEENVLGFKVEAVDSDIALTSVKVTLENLLVEPATDLTGSYRLTDYADSVEIYKGSTKVGEVDASDFTKKSADGVTYLNTYYTKSVSLSGVVIEEGDKDAFYVKVVATSNLDSSDVDQNNWEVTVGDIRFQDATGVIMSDTQSESTTFEFTDLSGSGDVELTISKATSSPSAGNVEVSDTGSTSNVKLLDFKLKAEGSDMSFDQMSVVLTASGATTAAMVEELVLKNGSDEIASTDTIGVSGANTTFDLDDIFTIDADSTETFSVYATIKEVDGTDFMDGDSLIASLTDANIAVEDENGDVVIDESGSATGASQYFYSVGAIVTYISESFTAEDAADFIDGTISIKFNVEAFGDNDVVFTEDQFPEIAGEFGYTLAGGTVTDALITSNDLEDDAGTFTITAGGEADFTLSVKFSGTSGFVTLQIDEVDGTTVSNVKTSAH
ncbi:TPA: peptidoglycan-binding protein [Candidatus Nomurabacteria bacterium]|nr:MAG: penicillin-resistant dd-carboxypeptidase-like protein [Parcubacteria bacterium RAAC4_OD1_1]HCY26069.1 peptidoglycan-binding protein [Candidatus Nomurabacteria bacterium]